MSHLNLIPALECELHDLAQPMTSLQCRLELAKMLGDKASLMEAVDGALLDMCRLTAALSRMREIVVTASKGCS